MTVGEPSRGHRQQGQGWAVARAGHLVGSHFVGVHRDCRMPADVSTFPNPNADGFVRDGEEVPR